jgi:hypothetical protein
MHHLTDHDRSRRRVGVMIDRAVLLLDTGERGDQRGTVYDVGREPGGLDAELTQLGGQAGELVLGTGYERDCFRHTTSYFDLKVDRRL